MKRIWHGVCAGMLLFFLGGTVAFADTHAMVRFGADNRISYEGSTRTEGNKHLIGTTFQGMAPGETKTETITLSNENPKAAAFYLSQETLKNLEETNQASGGAYTVNLSLGDSEENAQPLLDALAGGYQEGKASKNGLSDVDALKEYTYLTTLKQNETKNLYLTLHLEGEGIDSTKKSDYTASLAQIGMNFRVEEVASEPKKNVVTKTVTKIKDQVIPLADTVKTGDSSSLFTYSVLLVAGLGLMVGFRKKKKGVKQS
ncbi:MAG: LPXTG cell wall anchor domain-containing protein [Lachnospiraceae bacterium]